MCAQYYSAPQNAYNIRPVLAHFNTAVPRVLPPQHAGRWSRHACASISRSMNEKMKHSIRLRGHTSPGQKSEEAVLRYFHEVWNNGETDVLEEISHKGLIMHDQCWWEDSFEGRERCTRVIEEFLTAYKAMEYTVKHCLASEDGSVVMVHWDLKAINLGMFMGRPAGGQVVRIGGISSFEMQDGLIAELYTFRQSFAGDRSGVGVDPYAL